MDYDFKTLKYFSNTYIVDVQEMMMMIYVNITITSIFIEAMKLMPLSFLVKTVAVIKAYLLFQKQLLFIRVSI